MVPGLRRHLSQSFFFNFIWLLTGEMARAPKEVPMVPAIIEYEAPHPVPAAPHHPGAAQPMPAPISAPQAAPMVGVRLSLRIG